MYSSRVPDRRGYGRILRSPRSPRRPPEDPQKTQTSKCHRRLPATVRFGPSWTRLQRGRGPPTTTLEVQKYGRDLARRISCDRAASCMPLMKSLFAGLGPGSLHMISTSRVTANHHRSKRTTSQGGQSMVVLVTQYLSSYVPTYLHR